MGNESRKRGILTAMSKIDMEFNRIYKKLLAIPDEEMEEVGMFWKDGTIAKVKSYFGEQIVIKPEDGFPICTNKFVPVKSNFNEGLWIWQKRSNVVQELRDMGSKVWDEWELPDGTIGKAYGFQMDKIVKLVKEKDEPELFNNIKADNHYRHINMLLSSGSIKLNLSLSQTDYIINEIKYNPNSRRILSTMWNVDDLNDMSLPPCVHSTQWSVKNNKVTLKVTSRSSDTFLGLPFNISQYAMLHRLITEVTGRELGDLIFSLGDVHIYDRHIPLAEEFISRGDGLTAPKFWIDSYSVDSFYDFSYKDNFGLKEYDQKTGNLGAIPTEVSITKKELDRMNKKEEVHNGGE